MGTVSRTTSQPPLNKPMDDTQVGWLCRPSATLELQNSISISINDVAKWMRSNRLQLNTAKTEVLWSTSSRHLHLLPMSLIQVGTDQVMPVSVVRNLIYWCVDEVVCLKDCSCLFCDSASIAEYLLLISALRSSVTGFVPRSAAVRLW